MPVAKFLAALVGLFVVLLFAFAALTQPNHGGKSKAYYATMKADLRNLVTAQEAYFADSAVYAPSLEALGKMRYLASPGVVISITSAVADSFWTATARHDQLRAEEFCRIQVGLVDAEGIQLDGEPICPTQVRATRSWRFIWE